MGRIRIYEPVFSDYESLLRTTLAGADRVVRGDTMVKVFDDDLGQKIVIRGTGFTFSGTTVTGGTVTSVTLFAGNVKYALLNHFTDSLAAVMADVESANYQNFTERLGPTSFIGNVGIDVCVTGSANDIIHGGDSTDECWGQGGNDRVYGENGDDTLLGGDGSDLISGGSGFDYTSYRDAPAGLTVSLVDPTLNTGFAAGDTYEDVEGIEGSNYTDRLTGSDIQNAIYARGGRDIVNGLGGDDYLYGMAGNDRLAGGNGFDTLEGGAGKDSFFFRGPSEGADVISDFGATDLIRIDVSGFDTRIGIDGAHGFADPVVNFIVDGAPVADEGTFLYHSADGSLWFDADGTGAAGEVLIATLLGAPSLTAGDFYLA